MNKTVLITGAGGFIGSHLVETCVENGFKVKAFVHYNSRNNWGWLEQSPYINEFDVIAGNIRDYDSVYDAVKNCDNIFHLAALIGIPYSYISPIAYISTNIVGTYNILQAAKNSEVVNILITSTSETYGTAQYIPIDEKHPMVGQSPYSATKIGADHLALSYYHSFGLPVKIVRPFNTYGPRQSARAIIPTIITQILNDQKNIKLGNLYPTRDLTYVKDTINGFIEIAKSDRLIGEVTNIGMNDEISIRDLTKLIAELMEVKIKIISDEQRLRPEKSEVKRLHCDNSKILKYTNWKSKYSLRKGLIETIEWMKRNTQYYKPEFYNV